jgi:transcriptional regulator
MSEALKLDDELDSVLVGDNPQPTIDLGKRAGKRVAIDDLMARAMSGLLPRNRSLKSYEPDYIDERHLQAIMMRASGLQQSVIANFMGWTDAWTSIVLNHPDSQYILTKMVSYAADEVLDIQERIKAHAGEALDKVVEVMRNTQDQRLASANAFEILKMAGHGAVEKKEVRAEIAMPKESLSLLADAIKESKEIRAVEGVDYRVLSSTGNVSSESPAAPSESGRKGTDLPPSSDSPAEVQHDGSRVRVA